MKRILMIIAPENFRDEEFFEPKTLFETRGYKVTVASRGVRNAKGMLGASANVDEDITRVSAAEYDAIVFVGGTGAAKYFNDPMALKLARDASAAHKVIGAICIAPSILANAGILQGKRATAWPSEAANIERKGGTFVKQDVVVDEKIVTASGPRAASEFGKAIIKVLEGK